PLDFRQIPRSHERPSCAMGLRQKKGKGAPRTVSGLGRQDLSRLLSASLVPVIHAGASVQCLFRWVTPSFVEALELGVDRRLHRLDLCLGLSTVLDDAVEPVGESGYALRAPQQRCLYASVVVGQLDRMGGGRVPQLL